MRHSPIMVLMFTALTGCLPKALFVFEKTNSANQMRNNTLTLKQTDTIRVSFKDSLPGKYMFYRNFGNAGYRIQLDSKGRFKEHSFSDLSYPFAKRNYTGKWKFEEGLVTFKYRFGRKRYQYIPYKTHGQIFLVPSKNSYPFLSTLANNTMSLDSVHLATVSFQFVSPSILLRFDSSAIYKIK